MSSKVLITRRTLLRQSAALLAASALATPVRAARRGPVTVGAGEHTYEVQHDWARLPDSHAFGNTHGVGVDRNGFVHVKHTVHSSSQSGDAICVFDADGKFVRSWGAEFRGGAHGLTLVREPREDFLYLADCNRGVVRKTTLGGETVLEFAWPEASGLYETREQYRPTNVAVVPHDLMHDGKPHPAAGHIYVADGYGKSWIHQYDARGGYLRSFGGVGAERGQTSCPHGIAFDRRTGHPRLIVADRSNRRIQYFTLEGRHNGFVKDELRSPCHFDQRGGLLLVPDLEARVTLLDRDDKLVAHLGDGENFGLRDKPRAEFIAGKFIAPHSACFDADGNIFVVEWVEVGRVTRLRRV